MNFIFISDGNYPNQTAEAIRHSTISQGISENGHKVNFFVLSPQVWSSAELNYKGVNFKTFNEYAGKNKILKIFNLCFALFKMNKVIKQIHKEAPLDGIIVYSTIICVIQKTLSLGKKLNIKIFHERTELPRIMGYSSSFLNRIINYYYINKLIPGFSGIFVISDKLVDFFKAYNRNIKKILTVVDTDFFNNKINTSFDFPYIAYCGTMKGEKDGVPILIRSFAKLLNQLPSFKLLLIGNNSDKSSIKEIIDTIEKLDLKDKVIFTGLVAREEMPGLLGNAVLLVVSKPDIEQNTANFPIKIGEYLATGVPMVVTRVGEIHKFITDGENGFVAMPGSDESFYSKMLEALSDYERAKKIGLNGRLVAKEIFDYKIQSKLVTDFITGIHKK
jgi:glycosyltransferase involved in cell wall biosynthesis